MFDLAFRGISNLIEAALTAVADAFMAIAAVSPMAAVFILFTLVVGTFAWGFSRR